MALAVFLIFLGVLLLCVVRGWFVGWALLAGLALFFALGLRRGCRAGELADRAAACVRKSGVVLLVLALIGGVTGLWRASGTITYCVHHGLRLITPRLFLLLVFLMNAALSYVLGTSFGVASTAGVIMMALARFGGVSASLTAGAVLSGIYFGDRCSPVSSSASLVAAVTETSLPDNLRLMRRTGALPLALTAGVYGLLSVLHPLGGVAPALAAAVEQSFVLSPLSLLPVAVILALPLVRAPIYVTLLSSMAAAAGVAVGVQGMSLSAVLRAVFLGYRATGELEAVLSGGGVRGMLSTCLVVLLTSLCSGVLEGTRVLEPLEEKVFRLGRRWGRFPAAVLTGLGTSMVFCNQTIAVMLSEQLLRRGYGDRSELAIDIENAGVLLTALVPWSVAASAPLAMLEAGPEALPCAALLWMTPLCYLFTKKYFFPAGRAELPQAASDASAERQDCL